MTLGAGTTRANHARRWTGRRADVRRDHRRALSRATSSRTAATERLAQAFQTLVPDPERRSHLLGLAHDEAAASPLGQTGDFESTVGERSRNC